MQVAGQEDTGRASALLAFAALFPQRLLVSGGRCSLLLLQPQSRRLLLLLCVTLHVGAAALHLKKHPAAAGGVQVRDSHLQAGV